MEIDKSSKLQFFGPTINVKIGFDIESYFGKKPVSFDSQEEHVALIDTGASESCIDSELAALYNLPVIDRRPYHGINGLNYFNLHLCQIHIPELNFTMHGKFSGVHLSDGGIENYKALLGRDFLKNFKFEYDGYKGNFKITIPEDRILELIDSSKTHED